MALGYIIPTIIAIFFVGFYAPIVGIVVGFFIHIFILLLRITKKIEEFSARLEDREYKSS